MKYLEGIAVMFISNLICAHIQSFGVSILLSSISAIFIVMALMFFAHFVVNLVCPKQAKG